MTDLVVQRADLALADLVSNGGVLDPMRQDQFFRKIIDEPTLFREARTVQMNAPEMKIPKIGFGSRVLRVAPTNGGASGANDDGSNDRHLPAADRVRPDYGQVQMSTTEYIAEIHITDDLLEDNIEREQMAETIISLLAERVALDLEELLIQGDPALVGGDTYLGSKSGVLKLCTSNVVDAEGSPVGINVFNNMKKSLPTRYRRNLNALRFYTSMDVESDYRVQVASRGTDLGDAILTGSAPLPVLGVPLRGIALMPNTNGLLINPQNILFGLQRNVRIERERDIRARAWVIVVTMRIAMELEEEEAAVKLINLQPQAGD